MDGLQGLSGLRTLYLGPDYDWPEDVAAVVQLTGLRELGVDDRFAAGEELLLWLTQLRQLTQLNYDSPVGSLSRVPTFVSEVSYALES